MTSRLSVIFVLLWMAVAVHAQSEATAQKPPRFQIYGGYAFVK